ncbi:MAG: Eco57I restriction-modification methylase domain-containing protein [Planctomycetaceae bacterium]|nr:Eco57I restriction-modification methylase domain-containing protein [Planctomycetaceae bacterium]
MNKPTPTQPLVPPRIIALLVAAAKARTIAQARDAAILQTLQKMADDLIPGQNLFADLFVTPGDAEVLSPRAIGDVFWREAGTSREARRLEGSFYTPIPVIDAIIDMVWDTVVSLDATVCDPAVGCGFFPIRLLERLLEMPGIKPSDVRRWAAVSLFGCDCDARAVFMTRALVWLTLSDRAGEFVPGAENFALGDSLLGRGFLSTDDTPAASGLDWPTAFPAVASAGGFAVIIGNPPYEVLTNFARFPERSDLARALRASGNYRDALQGQVNLYRCFIERSLDLLSPGGRLSMVVPLSLARDRAALPLRQRLLRHEKTARWRLFSERDGLFDGVTQSACIFLAERNGGGVDDIVIESAAGRVTLPFAQVEQLGDDLFLPVMGEEGIRLWQWLRQNHTTTIAEHADLRVGEVDQTFFRDCMRDDDTGCVLARGTHLRAFYLDASPVPGKERFLDLPRFLASKGRVGEECATRAGTRRIVQLGIRNMQSRPRLQAAIAPPSVYLGNSVNVIVPKDDLPLEFLAGLMNSRLLDWLFCHMSGNNNINLHEVGALPYPTNPSPEAVRGVVEAYSQCAALVESGEPVDAGRLELDKWVYDCYGVPADLLKALDE